MRRRQRLIITLGSIAASIAVVLALLFAGSHAEGPVARVLHAIGGIIGRTENRAAMKLRGPGRAQELKWLERYRGNASTLAHPDTLLFGAYDDRVPATLDGILELERVVGRPLALVQSYAAWGDKPEQKFPDRFVEAVNAIGSIPVITWEPWLTDFENSRHEAIPLRTERDKGGLRTIADGLYDFYIDEWAKAAVEYGHPVMIRFAHEMNDPYRYPWGPQNNPPQDFIAAWRHVVDRFRAAGATNVLWIWSPHLAYAGWETYWPGDQYVDWISTGALNYGTVASWSKWWSFADIFGKHYAAFAGLKKPIMIAELGSVSVGGDRAQWYAQTFDSLATKYPAVRAVLFFNVRHDNTVTYQAIDWSILTDSATVRAVRPH